MTDLRSTIIPKSDQLNADDLIGGPLTVRVTKVSLCADEQPIAINYDGDGGKPYKPCKSMRRVMVKVWGPDGNAYAGRSMTLYRDDTVRFGAVDVGGIRISHMSGIEAPVTMALTATRAQRKPFTVRPLVAVAADKAADGVRALVGRINAADHAGLQAITAEAAVVKQRAWLAKHRPELAAQVDSTLSAALSALDDDGNDTSGSSDAREPEMAGAADDGWPGPR